MKIAMIMLAAGNSRRFGANKLLYEIDGIPMYRHVLEQLDDTKKKIENIYSEYSDITEDNNNDNNSDIVQLNNLYRNNITAKIICNIIVITQYDAIAEAVKTKEIQVLYNPHPEDGISSSVKIGLNASLDAADAIAGGLPEQPERLVFLHYPPVWPTAQSEGIVNTLQQRGIKRCYYGHLHGNSLRFAVQGEQEGIRYKLISADGLQFCPYKI